RFVMARRGSLEVKAASSEGMSFLRDATCLYCGDTGWSDFRHRGGHFGLEHWAAAGDFFDLESVDPFLGNAGEGGEAALGEVGGVGARFEQAGFFHFL